MQKYDKKCSKCQLVMKLQNIENNKGILWRCPSPKCKNIVLESKDEKWIYWVMEQLNKIHGTNE